MTIHRIPAILVISERPVVPSTPRRSNTCQKICYVAKIIFAILLSFACFLYTPTVFLICFTIGLIFPKAAGEGIKKIVQIWKKRTVVCCITLVACCVFGLPSVLLVTAGLYGLHVGNRLYRWGTKSDPTRTATVVLLTNRVRT